MSTDLDEPLSFFHACVLDRTCREIQGLMPGGVTWRLHFRLPQGQLIVAPRPQDRVAVYDPLGEVIGWQWVSWERYVDDRRRKIKVL